MGCLFGARRSGKNEIDLINGSPSSVEEINANGVNGAVSALQGAYLNLSLKIHNSKSIIRYHLTKVRICYCGVLFYASDG